MRYAPGRKQIIRTNGDTVEIDTSRGVAIFDNVPDVISIINEYTVNCSCGRIAYAIQNGRHKTKQSGLMHRLITKAPKEMQVDHINGNGLDNRRSNLRIVDQWQNMQNATAHSTSSTGVRGVFMVPSGKYRAQVVVNKSRIHLGYFKTFEAACNAVDQHRKFIGLYSR